jgi:hypothetical protein
MYNPKATGPLNEVGLMQMRHEYLDNPNKYYDARLNLKEGIKRLAKLKRLEPKLGSNWFCAWNLGAVGAIRMAKKKRLRKFHYCKSVKRRYSILVKDNQNKNTNIKGEYVSI